MYIEASEKVYIPQLKRGEGRGGGGSKVVVWKVNWQFNKFAKFLEETSDVVVAAQGAG